MAFFFSGEILLLLGLECMVYIWYNFSLLVLYEQQRKFYKDHIRIFFGLLHVG